MNSEPPANLTPQPVTTKQACGCVALLGILIFGGCAALAAYSNSQADRPSDSGAEVFCEQLVEDQLKSPRSADFTAESVNHVGDQWTVTGAVDSDNSFGASIRNTFTCVLRHNGDGWDLVSLTGLSN